MGEDNFLSAFNFFISYEFQNVFVYFMIIPFIWAIVIDYKWIRKPGATVVFGLVLVASILLCGGWAGFTQTFYYTGVQFCAYWKRFGYSYAETCIVWCIMWPMVISMVIMFIPSRKRNNIYNHAY